MKIGFFDSGLGGLLIMKSVRELLPEFDYEFYGDTAQLPYGDKTEAEIYELTMAGVSHLFAVGCAVVVIACNTASAETLQKIQQTILRGEYRERRVLGVILPTVEVVASRAVATVGLLATTRTVESGKYREELLKALPKVRLEAKPLPALVTLLEGGELTEAASLIRTEVVQFRQLGVNNFILGCTHYCLLKQDVRSVLGSSGIVFSQDEIIPNKLKTYLGNRPELTRQLGRQGTLNIYLTLPRPDYDQFIGRMKL